MRKPSVVLAVAASLSFTSQGASGQTRSIGAPAPVPPVAKKVPKTISAHGETWVDEYFWLREKSNPEVIAYLEAENAYAEAVMRPTVPLQERLYREMLSRIKETDAAPPYREGGYLYYTRSVRGRQYKVYARRRAAPGSREQVTLDLNELAKGHTYAAVNTYDVTRDGRLLAYSLDSTGYREYTLNIKDLSTGRTARVAERVSSAAWADDGRTLFYVTDDPVSKRPFRLYRHAPGRADDELVFEERDAMFELNVSRTRSRGYLLLTSASHTASEVRYLPAARPSEPWRVLRPREAGHEYYVEHRGDSFYIRTNEGGAKNFKLVVAPANDPRPENWKGLLPHRDDVAVEGVDLFADHYVVSEREAGRPRLRVTSFKDGRTHYLDFAEPSYHAALGDNREFDTRTLRFTYESFTTPASVYDYDMETRRRQLLKRQPVLGGFDPKQYASERVYAPASDGAQIPIDLVYRKGFRRDGAAPLLLFGYGAYGYPWPVEFDSNLFSLLDRGVVYALAHVRGGGENGKRWHEEGRMMRKKNTFTDFVAAAEHLIKERYTSKERLAATGLSAGGLLMGAVTNMRPDLFRVVVNKVPFVDVINTMLDDTLPLTAGEWEEWGNPVTNREHFRYMRSYSPYDNLAAKDYPAILVTTSLNDSQVLYHEPAKYVARLRALKTDRNPLLLKTNMGAGHGGAAGRYDALREAAFDYAFILTRLGVEQAPGPGARRAAP